MEQLSFLLSWRDEQSFFTAWAPAFVSVRARGVISGVD